MQFFIVKRRATFDSPPPNIKPDRLYIWDENLRTSGGFICEGATNLGERSVVTNLGKAQSPMYPLNLTDKDGR